MTPQVQRLPVAAGQNVALDWYPAVEAASGTVLYVPGLGSHRRGEKAQYFAARLHERGWAFAAADLRGHGESDGSMQELTMSRMLADVAVACDWVATRRPDAELVLLGASLGAALVAWHAVRNSGTVSRLIMIAPSLGFPASLTRSLGREMLEAWRQKGVHRVANQWIDVELGYELVEDGALYDPAELQRRHETPTLIVHGMHDDVVDWTASAGFAQRSRSPVDLYLLSHGDHRLTGQKERVFDILWAWLARDAEVPPSPGRIA